MYRFLAPVALDFVMTKNWILGGNFSWHRHLIWFVENRERLGFLQSTCHSYTSTGHCHRNMSSAFGFFHTGFGQSLHLYVVQKQLQSEGIGSVLLQGFSGHTYFPWPLGEKERPASGIFWFQRSINFWLGHSLHVEAVLQLNVTSYNF